MASVILIILISLLIFASTAVSNESKLFNKNAKFLKKLTNTGWVVLVINLGIIALSVGQYRIGETESAARDSLQRKSYEESVEEINKNSNRNAFELKYSYDTTSIRLKNRYDTSTASIIKALAKYYGLQYDSARKIITRLEKIPVGPPPDLHLATENEIEWDSTKNHFFLNFQSNDAPSKNLDIHIYTLVKVNGNFYPYFNKLALTPLMEIPKDAMIEIGFILPYKVEELLFYIKGTYTNFIGDQVFPVEQIYAFSTVDKRTKQLTKDFFEKYKKRFEEYIQEKKL